MKRRTFFLSVTLAMILQINSGKISSQNVAITNDATFTTPQSILHLYRNADGSLLQLSNPTTTAGVNRGLYFTATLNDFSLINNEAGSLSFHTSNTQRAIILSTGQFGINMTPVMMLDVTSASTTAGDAAIRGASTGNAAVYGVQGTISSTTLNAAGVYGYASGNAQVFGVYGSLPASNITANASGVRGYVPASAGNVYGVFGESAATGASSAGIRGLTTGNNGTGVYAQAQGAGTSYAFRGTATGAGTTNYAAYLSASGATTNYGLFVNAGGVRFVPLASGANGAVLRTNNTGDLVITNFSGSAGDVLLGTGAFGPATTSGTAWQLAGNTLVGTEFIGSTNLQPFIIRTNNTERARVLSGGNILFNRTTALYATDMFEVQGDATFPDAISGYTSIIGGNALYGENTAGGASSSILGLINSATGFGIQAFNTNVSGTGLISSGNNITSNYLAGGSGGAFSGSNVGVYGYGNNTAASWGVYGQSANTTGDGIVGYNSAAAGGGIGTGMWGSSAQNGGGTSMAAVEAYNGNATGTGLAGAGNNLGIVTLVNGSGGSFSGQTIGVWGRTTQAGVTQNAGVYGYCNSLGRGSYLSLYNGTYYKTVATGVATNSCAVPDLDGNMVCMHAPETPEAYFQDFGQGQLTNGKAHIFLDPIFAKNVTINEKHPLRVYIQLEGESNGVYVTNKTQTGFDVIELNSGTSNAPFQWFITCNMADSKGENGLISKFADLRFEPAPKVMEENKSQLLEYKILNKIEKLNTLANDNDIMLLLKPNKK